MENQNNSPLEKRSRIMLGLYIAICTILILIVLLAPFQNSGYGVQGGELYLNPSTSESQ